MNFLAFVNSMFIIFPKFYINQIDKIDRTLAIHCWEFCWRTCTIYFFSLLLLFPEGLSEFKVDKMKSVEKKKKKIYITVISLKMMNTYTALPVSCRKLYTPVKSCFFVLKDCTFKLKTCQNYILFSSRKFIFHAFCNVLIKVSKWEFSGTAKW
jgi:hypothetical protein